MALGGFACQGQPLHIDTGQLAAYSERMQPAPEAEEPASDAPPAEMTAEQASTEEPPTVQTPPEQITPTVPDARLVGKLVQDPEGDGPTSAYVERIQRQLSPPEQAKQWAQQELAATTSRIKSEPLKLLIARLETIERPRKLRLALDDVLQRTLANNFAIRVSSYNPAVEATRIVEAEALFDVSFFTNLSNNDQNQPAQSSFAGTEVDIFSGQVGIRKLLASGMQVEASYSVQRTETDVEDIQGISLQAFNPQWFDQFVVQFRQPLLRGFGVDFNRSQIRLQKLGQRRATQEFRRQVRDVLRQTEEAYWRLSQARAGLVIAARLLADFEQIYNFLYERRDFDVYNIQLADTKARLERSKADFAQRIADVRNAEDQLIAYINDPEIDLADDVEIIPLDLPNYRQLVIDRVAEVQTALENRAELVEAKIAIDSARVQVGVTKNQAQPQLDLTFRYSVDGLGGGHDDAFEQTGTFDFAEYFVGLEFELPVGNRARRAALHRAKLQYGQAIAGLKQAFEQIILDVNVAVRAVQVNYDQIGPSLRSAEANEDQVDSIIARAEKKDFLTLNQELNARQGLAQARSALLSALIDYSIAVVDLERAKGTLLRYNSIELVFDDSDDPAH